MIKYFYIRTPDKKNPTHRGAPVACVAYKREVDPDMEGHDIVMFAMSVANSDSDEFLKFRARQIATGRLNSLRYTADGFNVDTKATSTDVIRTLVAYVADSGTFGLNLPSRVRNAAKKWLKKTAVKSMEAA